jgi:hypothetical protein
MSKYKIKLLSLIVTGLLSFFVSQFVYSQNKFEFDFEKNWEWTDLLTYNATLSNDLLSAVKILVNEYSIDEARFLFRTLTHLDSLNQVKLLPGVSALDPTKNRSFRKYLIEKELNCFDKSDDFKGLIQTALVVTNIKKNFSPNRKIFNNRQFYLKTIGNFDTNTVINFDCEGALQIINLVTKDSLTYEDYRIIENSPYLNMVYNRGEVICTSKEIFTKSLYYARRKEPIVVLYKFINPSSFLNLGYVSVYSSNFINVINTFQSQRENIKFYIINLLSQYFPKGAKFNVIVNFLFGYENCNWNMHSENLPVNITLFGDDYEYFAKYLVRELFIYEKDNTFIDVFPYLFSGSDTLILQIIKDVFEGGISNYIAPILAENRPASLMEKDFLLFKSTIYAILQKKNSSVIDSLISLGRDSRFLFYTMGTQMATSIDQIMGREYIKKSLVRGPISFFVTYIETYHNDPSKIRDIFRFRSEFENKIYEMNSVINKQMYLDFAKMNLGYWTKEEALKNVSNLEKKYGNRKDKYIFDLLAGQFLQTYKILDKSFEYFEKALPFLPDKNRSSKKMGNLFFANKGYALAAKMYSKYIDYSSKNPDAYFCRAEVYYLSNEYEKAKADYEKVLQLDPENKASQKKLQMINEELKNK